MLYLSQAIGRPVLDRNGEPIGKVADLIVAVGDRYPPVTGLVVATDRRRIFLPWSSVEPLDATGARLRTHDDRHRQVPAAPERDPPARRPAGQADRRHRRPQGRPGQRPAPRRGRGPAPPGRGRRRGGRAAPPARHRGRATGRSPANLRPADPGALHRLGGRRPGRDARSPRSSCACPHAGLAELHPADLATIIDQLAPARPGRRPRLARRRGGGRRHRGDGARDAGRGPRGPRARSAPPTSSRR